MVTVQSIRTIQILRPFILWQTKEEIDTYYDIEAVYSDVLQPLTLPIVYSPTPSPCCFELVVGEGHNPGEFRCRGPWDPSERWHWCRCIVWLGGLQVDFEGTRNVWVCQ